MGKVFKQADLLNSTAVESVANQIERLPAVPAPVASRLAYSIEETARLINCGKTTLYALAAAGKLRITKLTKRKSVVLADDLDAFIQNLREETRP